MTQFIIGLAAILTILLPLITLVALWDAWRLQCDIWALERKIKEAKRERDYIEASQLKVIRK
ncbi:MAG: hypothetical protein ACR2PR_08815 [Pseudohongiellaceae bacterium]